MIPHLLRTLIYSDGLSLDLPTVTLSSEVFLVTEGDNVTLICNTTGIPSPFIEWNKVGDSTVLSNTSVLTLHNIKRPGTANETVQYRCTAKNGYGDQASAVVTVHVYCEYLNSNTSQFKRTVIDIRLQSFKTRLIVE